MSSLGEQIQNLREKLQSLGKKGGGGGDAGGSGGAKFDPKAALAWVKSNPVIVASVAVMVIAPATASLTYCIFSVVLLPNTVTDVTITRNTSEAIRPP